MMRPSHTRICENQLVLGGVAHQIILRCRIACGLFFNMLFCQRVSPEASDDIVKLNLALWPNIDEVPERKQERSSWVGWNREQADRYLVNVESATQSKCGQCHQSGLESRIKFMIKSSMDLWLHLWIEGAQCRSLIQDWRWQVSLIETAKEQSKMFS